MGKTPVQFLVDIRQYRLHPWELVAWAWTAKSSGAFPGRDEVLDEIASVDPRVTPLSAVERLLWSLVPEAERSGVHLGVLAEAADGMLRGAVTPHEFCQAVWDVEADAMDGVWGPYPRWLGDLWNDCDWVTELETRLDEVPHLADWARRLVSGELRVDPRPPLEGVS